jgi:hypothetical protein
MKKLIMAGSCEVEDDARMGSKFVFPGLFCWLLGAGACSEPSAPTSKSAEPAAASDTSGKPASTAPDLHQDCCTQCTNAARRDQAGTALEPIDCRKYAGHWNGARGLDKTCGEHFNARRTTVGECWQSFPALK